MRIRIRDMTCSEIGIFADVIHDLSVRDPSRDPRRENAARILELMRADTLASYIWDAGLERYDDPVIVNQDPANIREYLRSLQFIDPLTPRMRACRGATVVEEVFPMVSLRRTPFYQDFLKPDGMFHGINVFHDIGGGRTIDLRVWRRKSRDVFSEREVDLLNTLVCFLGDSVSAQPSEAGNHLTAREQEIARLVARGCTDREIARLLGISFSTVRTHVNRCFEKLDCANRAELSARFAVTLSRQI